ncbi:dienelactone hydrolase family protein [soil metagenome]
MPIQDIEYTADGAILVGRLFRPDGKANGAAVLVAHEGPGLSDHTYTIAGRLADLGYVAFALDYHGGGQAVGMDVARGRIGAWLADPAGIRARATAALAVLTSQPGVDPARVAGIGYCFGGTTVLELARSGANLAAVVGFHSGLGTARSQDAVNIKGKVLTLIGTADPLIPPEQRVAFEAEMSAAKVDWQMHLYGGVAHSFTNPEADGSRMPGILYDAGADRRSWREMLALFGETIDR